MTDKIFCFLFRTSSDHHIFNAFVDQLRNKLNIIHDEVHSKDEHYWIYFLKCDRKTFEKVKHIAETQLTHITFFDAFQIGVPNCYSMKRSGDKPVILNPIYGM